MYLILADTALTQAELVDCELPSNKWRVVMSIHADTQKELELFLSKYEIRGSEKCLEPYEDRPVLTRDGLRGLKPAPAKRIHLGFPPSCSGSRGYHTYIWVIEDMGLLFIREKPLRRLDRSSPHHSNLPFCQKAYIGGELWFETEERIYVSGGSGRYPPLSAEHLADAIKVFEAYGYDVTSLGWDCDKGEAKRCLESPPDA